MTVTAIVPDYADRVEVADAPEKFHGNIVVYVHWEQHLSFCAALAFPLPPAMPFGALVERGHQTLLRRPSRCRERNLGQRRLGDRRREEDARSDCIPAGERPRSQVIGALLDPRPHRVGRIGKLTGPQPCTH